MSQRNKSKKTSKKKAPAQTGSVAANPHEGTRSEYLAQYIFSAFGTAVPVPRPEDAGIDIMCALGEAVGQRMFMRRHYYVQIKSNSNPIMYHGENSVRWLLSLSLPLVIAVINKQQSRIAIYLSPTTAAYRKRSDIRNFSFEFESTVLSEINIAPKNTSEITVPLGKPILEFSTNDIVDRSFRQKAARIMDYWISLDADNLQSCSMGLPLVHLPRDFQTNELPPEPLVFKGNMAESINPASAANLTYIDNLGKLLCLSLLEAGGSGNHSIYQSQVDACKRVLSSLHLTNCWGLRLLAGIDKIISRDVFDQPGSIEFHFD